MRTSRGIALLLALCAFVALASSAFAEKAPVGSFVNDGVSTISDLLAQLKDPKVAERYEAVYNIPASELASKLNDFKLITLKSPIETPVYYVDKSGKIVSKTQILPQGTAVFADKNGNPSICWWTGNPMGNRNAIAAVTGDAGAAAVAGSAGAAGTAVGAGAAAAGSAGVAAWAIPAIAAVGAVAIVSNSDDDTVLPEPTGIIALATGLAGLPLIRRFKSSK